MKTKKTYLKTQTERDIAAAIKCMTDAEKLRISQAGVDPWHPSNQSKTATIVQLEAEALRRLRNIATRKLLEK